MSQYGIKSQELNWSREICVKQQLKKNVAYVTM